MSSSRRVDVSEEIKANENNLIKVQLWDELNNSLKK